MAGKGRDGVIVAIESVYDALKDLDAASRQRVLSSAFALLGVESPKGQVASQAPTHAPLSLGTTQSARPIGLVELMNEKRPGTNAQRIAVFAYYRERTESKSRFSRSDLESYFATAKVPPARNYSRDFGEAVRAGWIHEDGAESYLTTKGIEAVENGFEGQRKYTVGKKKKPTAKNRKNAGQTKRARKSKR